MKITVVCNICNTQLVEVEGPNLGSNEQIMYESSCSCGVDGPFQTYDDNGNPLPMNYSNIIATLSE